MSIAVNVGDVVVGGGAPVSIQSMWKSPVSDDRAAILHRLQELHALGCQIMRFSVLNMEAAHLIGNLSQDAAMPLVADIHYDYKLAMCCLDYPFGKIRINPGNIGDEWKVKEVARKAADRNIPIRIGVNSGSLPPVLRREKDLSGAMVKAAEMEIEALEKVGFSAIIVSLKSPSVESTVEANVRFAAKYPFPLHIGVTEAGPLVSGVVKNTLAVSKLLKEGVGDTVRVSLSGREEDEIITAREVLRAENSNRGGVNIISCPTCSRASFDVRRFLNDLGDYLYRQKKNVTVAVMGCPVNGLEEASHADLGITGFGKKAVLFSRGVEVCRVDEENALVRFMEEFEKL